MTEPKDLFTTMKMDRLLADEYAKKAREYVKEFSRSTYRFVAGVAQMQKEFHDEFVQMIENEGKTVTEWMNEHFEVIEAMGETRERILAAIEAGVTEDEYVAQCELETPDHETP